jgi:hypothetical protein
MSESTYAGERLQEHQCEPDRHAVSNTLLEELHKLLLLALAVGTTLLDLSTDLAHLVLDVPMRCIEAPDLAQNPLSTLEVILLGKIPR